MEQPVQPLPPVSGSPPILHPLPARWLSKPEQAQAHWTPSRLGLLVLSSSGQGLSSGVFHTRKTPHPASAPPCRCSLQTQADPARYHIPAVCPRAVAGRETVDASETWHRETAQGGEKEGQPYLSQTLLLLAHSHAAPLRFLSVP